MIFSEIAIAPNLVRQKQNILQIIAIDLYPVCVTFLSLVIPGSRGDFLSVAPIKFGERGAQVGFHEEESPDGHAEKGHRRLHFQPTGNRHA